MDDREPTEVRRLLADAVDEVHAPTDLWSDVVRRVATGAGAGSAGAAPPARPHVAWARLYRRLAVAAAVIAVMAGLTTLAVRRSTPPADPLAGTPAGDAVTEVTPLRLVLASPLAPLRLTLAETTEPAAPANRRRLAVLAAPTGTIAVVEARRDGGDGDGTWPPSGVEATLTLADGSVGYLDPDLEWRHDGVRLRVLLGTDTPDRAVLRSIADATVARVDGATGAAALAVTPPTGWSLRYLGPDPDDAARATVVYRDDHRTLQITTVGLDGGIAALTARAPDPPVSVQVRGTAGALWRDRAGAFTSPDTAHLVWQERDGGLVHVQTHGINDDEVVALADALTPASDAAWLAALEATVKADESATIAGDGGAPPPPPPTT